MGGHGMSFLSLYQPGIWFGAGQERLGLSRSGQGILKVRLMLRGLDNHAKTAWGSSANTSLIAGAYFFPPKVRLCPWKEKHIFTPHVAVFTEQVPINTTKINQARQPWTGFWCDGLLLSKMDVVNW